jgi:hypothetical protein
MFLLRYARWSYPRAPDPVGAPATTGERPLPRVEGPPCPVVCLHTHGRERPMGTVWRTRCTTRLVWDARPGPYAWRIVIKRLEGEGDAS